MSTPDSRTTIPFSKGELDDSLTIPTGIGFEPIDDRERLAAEDPAARQVPVAQWQIYLDRLRGHEITPENISRVTNLPEDDAIALYAGLSARGWLEKVRPPKKFLHARGVGSMVLRDEAMLESDTPPKEWGVVIVDNELNGHDGRAHTTEASAPKLNPEAAAIKERVKELLKKSGELTPETGADSTYSPRHLKKP
jgi:hypothetical protein